MGYNEIGLVCAQNIETMLGLIVNTIGRVYVIVQRKKEHRYDLLQFLYVNSNHETSNDNLHDLQLPNLFVVLEVRTIWA